ncbi:MAG: hypothetical protein VKP62_00870 [Candidatus Sericytochromatia bacterium]|nr:hypothetical protein [Candidatus Sericytochromatia bacterium]
MHILTAPAGAWNRWLVPAAVVGIAACSPPSVAPAPVLPQSATPTVAASLSVSTASPRLRPLERVMTLRTGEVLSGKALALGSLAPNAAVVRAERFDVLEARIALLPVAVLAFRLQQMTVEKPLQDALVSPLGPDFNWAGGNPGAYTDEAGRFSLRFVSPSTTPFLDVRAHVGGRTFRMFGWTRSREGVTVDLASTLVVREVLRFRQRSENLATFNAIRDGDVEPLLLRLRRLLEGGLPAGLSFDPYSVSVPLGDWTQEGDRADGALRLLDELARRDANVSRDIDRLYMACNVQFTGMRDTARLAVSRPGRQAAFALSPQAPPTPTPARPPTAAPTSSPSPSPSPSPSASPSPGPSPSASPSRPPSASPSPV